MWPTHPVPQDLLQLLPRFKGRGLPAGTPECSPAKAGEEAPSPDALSEVGPDRSHRGCEGQGKGRRVSRRTAI